MSTQRTTAAAVVLVCCASNANGQEFGLVLGGASDWIYHGVSETRGEPALGINAQWQLSPKWVVGLEAHEGRTRAERQRERSVFGYLAFEHRLSEDWLSVVSLQHRRFPGGQKAWEFSELEVQFDYRDRWSVRFDYSPNYYSHNSEVTTVEIDYSQPIGESAYWRGQVGALRHSRDRFDHYQFATLGIGRSFGATNVEAAYVWNSNNSNDLFGAEDTTSPGLVLSINYRLR